jgi:C4-type Zn-finger protein
VSRLTLSVHNVTGRCPVCGGSANARYHAQDYEAVAHMKHKCTDCGFTWEEVPVSRSL